MDVLRGNSEEIFSCPLAPMPRNDHPLTAEAPERLALDVMRGFRTPGT
jgi:hypothetical protein